MRIVGAAIERDINDDQTSDALINQSRISFAQLFPKEFVVVANAIRRRSGLFGIGRPPSATTPSAFGAGRQLAAVVGGAPVAARGAPIGRRLWGGRHGPSTNGSRLSRGHPSVIAHPAVRAKFQVSAALLRPDGVQLRLLSDYPPSPQAQAVEPGLEDAYVWLLAQAPQA